MMTKFSKSHQSDIMYSVDFCLRSGKVYGKNAESFKSYTGVRGRNKVTI